MHSLHSFARHRHGAASATPAIGTDEITATTATKGLVLNGGWRYDLNAWLIDRLMFRGQWRALRRRTIALAGIQMEDQVLDVGCGTGTLALEMRQRMGGASHVVGIDPSGAQIARARAKAARRALPVAFEVGVIERLPFAGATFDVAVSTLMMHHLPAGLKRQGLAEIARVLKPGGRLVIADFARIQDRAGLAARFHAGGSDPNSLAEMARAAGFDQVDIEEMRPVRFSAFPGAAFLTAIKR